MSLLSTNIAKVKRLSLKEVKLPTRERKVESITPILVERPPTKEEIAYSRILSINPQIGELVKALDLVSTETLERIKEVSVLEPPQPPRDEQYTRLVKFAMSIIEEENNYSREEIIERIVQTTGVDVKRAERGFISILEANVIEPTIDKNRFYLTSSTPF